MGKKALKKIFGTSSTSFFMFILLISNQYDFLVQFGIIRCSRRVQFQVFEKLTRAN